MTIENAPFQTRPATSRITGAIDGELVTEFDNGRTFVLAAGESYVVAEGDGAHRSSTHRGARLLIVD